MQHLLCRWASLVAELVKNLPATRGPGWDPWVGKIPWRRDQLLTAVFWPGELHGLYSPWGLKESDMTERPSLLLCRFQSTETKWTWSYPHLYYYVDSTVLKPNGRGHTPISAFLPPAHLPWPHLNCVLMSRMNFLQHMSQLYCYKCSEPKFWRLMLLNCGVGEDSWESLRLQGEPASPS